MNNEIKKMYEQLVLGSIISFGNYLSYAHVISPSNFTNETNGLSHRILIDSIITIQKTKPIDYSTVFNHLLSCKINRNTIYVAIGNLCQKVVTDYNTYFHAFSLLEICMMERFEKVLLELKQEASEESKIYEVAIDEIHQSIQNEFNRDVILIIKKSGEYLKKIGYEHGSETLHNLANQVSLRISDLKKHTELITTVNMLGKYCHISNDNKQNIQVLINNAIQIALTNKISNQQITALNILSQNELS